MKRLVSLLCIFSAIICLMPKINADSVLLGDANGDGYVDTADASAILKYIINEGTVVMKNADCDGRLGIDTADASAILKYIIHEYELSAPIDEYEKISGTSFLTAEQLSSYMVKKLGGNTSDVKLNCSIYELATYYIEEGNAEGIRGDIAFMQSVIETGWFRFPGTVQWTQNNFCGLGATGGPAMGAVFDTPRLGVRAQIQHLKAYANSEPLVNDIIDPRFTAVSPRGKANNMWTGLNGKWAVPGTDYGEKIIAKYVEAKGMDVNENYVALAKVKVAVA